MVVNELTGDQLLENNRQISRRRQQDIRAQIVKNYQLSNDYSERLAKIFETPITKISNNDIPPVTEPFPKTLEDAVKSALWEKGYKFSPASEKL